MRAHETIQAAADIAQCGPCRLHTAPHHSGPRQRRTAAIRVLIHERGFAGRWRHIRLSEFTPAAEAGNESKGQPARHEQ